MALIRKFFDLRTQKGSPVAHSPYIILRICSTVGQSIASISDLSEHIYLSALHLGKYDASSDISAMDLPTVLYILHIVW